MRTVIQLRTDDEEKARWVQAAARSGMSLSDWIRVLANRACTEELAVMTSSVMTSAKQVKRHDRSPASVMTNEQAVMTRTEEGLRASPSKSAPGQKPKTMVRCARCVRLGLPGCVNCVVVA